MNDTGTVKLENVSKTDSVYINGSYAGTAKKFRSLYLEPGNYTISVKKNGQDILNRQVYVITGKTIKLDVGDKVGTAEFKNASK